MWVARLAFAIWYFSQSDGRLKEEQQLEVAWDWVEVDIELNTIQCIAQCTAHVYGKGMVGGGKEEYVAREAFWSRTG